MDYDKLIEDLKCRGLSNGSALGYHSGLYDDAATAIETLQIENQALRNAANGFKAENSMLRKMQPVELSGESARAFELAQEVSRLHAENAEMEKQLNEFSKFLCHMTGNLLSKTNYTAREMITASEDYQQRVCDNDCDLRADLARVTAERDALIKRTTGECWSCIRRYECNSRKGPHSRCWEFDPWLLKED